MKILKNIKELYHNINHHISLLSSKNIVYRVLFICLTNFIRAMLFLFVICSWIYLYIIVIAENYEGYAKAIYFIPLILAFLLLFIFIKLSGGIRKSLVLLSKILLTIFLTWLLISSFNYITSFTKPIRFESFRTSDDLKSFILNKFPVGTDIEIVVVQLEKSGAKCRYMERNGQPSLNDFEYRCEYSTGVASFYLLEDYVVWVKWNNDHQLIHIYTGRYKGIY